jgi:hypothetical protein
MTAREVTLYGGPSWGFRMTGGSDQGTKLRIVRVRKEERKDIVKDEVMSAREASSKCNLI